MKRNNKVIKHLKGDIKTFKKEEAEDRELIKSLKSKKTSKHKSSKKKDPKPKEAVSKKKPVAKSKVEKVMHEFKSGQLHSGSKKGPVVNKRSQAIAIALSEGRKAAKTKKKKKK